MSHYSRQEAKSTRGMALLAQPTFTFLKWAIKIQSWSYWHRCLSNIARLDSSIYWKPPVVVLHTWIAFEVLPRWSYALLGIFLAYVGCLLQKRSQPASLKKKHAMIVLLEIVVIVAAKPIKLMSCFKLNIGHVRSCPVLKRKKGNLHIRGPFEGQWLNDLNVIGIVTQNPCQTCFFDSIDLICSNRKY